MRRARKKLKTLDGEVGKALIALARGQLTAYVTTGHGEITWDKGVMAPRSAQGVKQLLELWNFKVKKLSLTDGLGDAIPDDADVVLILGPTKPFIEAEISALERYLDGGGALLVAAEPKIGQSALRSDGLDPLLKKLGVEREDGVLASTQQVVAISRNRRTD